jgi:hypothetical protein
MVEVFKTNVTDKTIADEIVQYLNAHFPKTKINFDLADCDNILRLEADNVCVENVIKLMNALGRPCEVLN